MRVQGRQLFETHFQKEEKIVTKPLKHDIDLALLLPPHGLAFELCRICYQCYERNLSIPTRAVKVTLIHDLPLCWTSTVATVDHMKYSSFLCNSKCGPRTSSSFHHLETYQKCRILPPPHQNLHLMRSPCGTYTHLGVRTTALIYQGGKPYFIHFQDKMTKIFIFLVENNIPHSTP